MAFRAASSDDDEAELAEINVTPFIDVMLVLLIVFMVAAPLSTVAVPVALPGSTAAPAPDPVKPLALSLGADLGLRLQDQPVTAAGLQAALDAASGADRTQLVQVLADRAVSYADLMAALDLLRAAGYLKVALVGLERPVGATQVAP